MNATASIVSKVWSFCTTMRDHDYGLSVSSNMRTIQCVHLRFNKALVGRVPDTLSNTSVPKWQTKKMSRDAYLGLA